MTTTLEKKVMDYFHDMQHCDHPTIPTTKGFTVDELTMAIFINDSLLLRLEVVRTVDTLRKKGILAYNPDSNLYYWANRENPKSDKVILRQYIRGYILQGNTKTKDQIYDRFSGYPQEDIDLALSEINGKYPCSKNCTQIMNDGNEYFIAY